MKKLILILTMTLLSSHLVVAQSKKELKEQEKLERYKAMKTMVESGSYVFKANSALTQKGRNINLSTSANKLLIDGKIAEADLPYFGVVQFPTMNSDGGINFKNENTEYDIQYNDKKQKITVKFSAKNKSEQFDLYLTIGSSGYASLSVTSNKRNSISYNGSLEAVEPKTD